MCIVLSLFSLKFQFSLVMLQSGGLAETRSWARSRCAVINTKLVVGVGGRGGAGGAVYAGSNNVI